MAACQQADQRLFDDVVLALDGLAHVGLEADQSLAGGRDFGGGSKITHRRSVGMRPAGANAFPAVNGNDNPLTSLSPAQPAAQPAAVDS